MLLFRRHMNRVFVITYVGPLFCGKVGLMGCGYIVLFFHPIHLLLVL